MKPAATPVVLAALSGVIFGIIGYHGWITLSGSTIDGADTLSAQASRIAELEAENQELSEDLFRAPAINIPAFKPDDPPYSDTADAVADVAEARERAIREAKFLLIAFSANWCVDCRTLYQNLKTDEVRDYAGERFVFANVNVGKFNRNTEFATTLGVSLERGIPAAVFLIPTVTLSVRPTTLSWSRPGFTRRIKSSSSSETLWSDRVSWLRTRCNNRAGLTLGLSICF